MNTLLSMTMNVKMMHWLAKSYVEHEALGKLYEEMDDNIDKLVESLMGLKGHRDLSQLKNIQCANYWSPKKSFKHSLEDMHDELVQMRSKLPDDSAQSIMDDIINSFRVAKYLVSMA